MRRLLLQQRARLLPPTAAPKAASILSSASTPRPALLLGSHAGMGVGAPQQRRHKHSAYEAPFLRVRLKQLVYGSIDWLIAVSGPCGGA